MLSHMLMYTLFSCAHGRPLEGTRVGVVSQMMGAGVAEGVASCVQHACRHLESLGASVEEVSDAWSCCGS